MLKCVLVLLHIIAPRARCGDNVPSDVARVAADMPGVAQPLGRLRHAEALRWCVTITCYPFLEEYRDLEMGTPERLDPGGRWSGRRAINMAQDPIDLPDGISMRHKTESL